MARDWRWIAIVLLGAAMLFAGCNELYPALPGVIQPTLELEQPVTLDQIYQATSVAVVERIVQARVADSVDVDAAELLLAGQALYRVQCAPCHRLNGEGNLGRFPALNGSGLVTAPSPQPLIRTVLYGRGVMPAFHVTLNDFEVAAVLSYIRDAWGNDASIVRPEDIERPAP
jgi:mono/diheme cytochrome c family protein